MTPELDRIIGQIAREVGVNQTLVQLVVEKLDRAGWIRKGETADD